MKETLRILIEALREELKHYGEMLVLLDRQHEFLKAQEADKVSGSIGEVRVQGLAIEAARGRRELCFHAMRGQLGLADRTGVGELIPRLPSDYQPLVQALVEENTELLSSVRRRARQNHLLLKRSGNLMEQLMSSVFLPESMALFDHPNRLSDLACAGSC